MTSDGAIELLRNLFLTVGAVAGPALMTALIVGVIIGILQAATQINEASISFVVKVSCVGVVLIATGPYLIDKIVTYTQHSFRAITQVVR